MRLVATRDFTAAVGGGKVELKKGQPFSGAPIDAERLERAGLLEKEPPKRRREGKDE